MSNDWEGLSLDTERGTLVYFKNCGSSSVVERNLAKVEVAGSSPVSRSRH